MKFYKYSTGGFVMRHKTIDKSRFVLLKAKHQQTLYKNPQNQSESIKQIEYTAHARIKGIKVKQTIKPQTAQQTAQQNTPHIGDTKWEGYPVKVLYKWNGKEWVPA